MSRSFSRSAALTWAAYFASRTALRTRPNRSGSQETSKGISNTLKGLPEEPVVVLPVVPPAGRCSSGRGAPGGRRTAGSARAVGQGARAVRPGGRRRGRQGRKILRAVDGDLRARRHEILKIKGDVLVVDVELILELVELRLVEHFPPFTLQGRVLRLRGLPGALIGGLVGGGRAFLEGSRRIDFGFHIRRPYTAGQRGHAGGHRHHKSYLISAIHKISLAV